MKVFEKRSIIKKMTIVLLLVLICSFCFSGKVQAEGDFGGKLLSPICDFIVFLGDGLMNIVHTVIYHQNDTTITVDMTADVLEVVSTILVGVFIAVVAAVLIVFTAGAVVAAAASIGLTLSTIGVGTVLLVSTTAGVAGAAVFNSNVLPDNIQMPVYQISPEQIFSNEVLLFDVDFFNPKSDEIAKDVNGKTIKDENNKTIMLESTAKQLRSTISNWYVMLRDIALVGLLSVLVYTGIKILISSTSNDKAKYKQMLIDWLVAICLLFFMQYIMSFSNLFVGKITEVISNVKYDNGYFSLIEDTDGKVSEKLEEIGFDLSGMKVTEDSKEYINWKTNLLGIARLNAQMAKDKSASYAGYALIFIVLVFLTLYFIVTYLKRVIYMAFLTLISPLVALTYPIDKMNDGKAQAFDMWFKEYIFNLLIQPMHLVLYTVLVSSAYELASTNIIYSLVALGFMMPAEKLLRKFFGFEKAHTPGLLAGPAGAAATMGIMNKLLGKGAKGGGKSFSGNGSGSGSGDSATNSKIKYKSNLDENAALYGATNDQNQSEEIGNGTTETNNNDGYEDFLEDVGNPENHIPPSTQREDPALQDPNYMYMHPGEYDSNGNYIGNNADTIRFADSNTNNEESEVSNKYDIPIEDRIAARGTKFGDNVGKGLNYLGARGGQLRDGFRMSSAGQTLNLARMGVANSGLGRTLRNSRSVGALKSGVRFYANGMKNKLTDKVKNGQPIKGAIKAAGGLAVGATAASIGLAAGIASGDPSKALQYTAGAALGGYKFGTGMTGSAAKALSVEGALTNFEEAYYGKDEYKERQIQKNIQNYQRDAKMKAELEKKMGSKEEAKNVINNVLPDCIRYGVTNVEDIAAVAKLEKKGIDRQKSIAVSKNVQEIGKDTNRLSAKDSEELDKTLRSRAKNNKNLRTDEEINKVSSDVRKLMNMYSDIRYDD